MKPQRPHCVHTSIFLQRAVHASGCRNLQKAVCVYENMTKMTLRCLSLLPAHHLTVWNGFQLQLHTTTCPLVADINVTRNRIFPGGCKEVCPRRRKEDKRISFPQIHPVLQTTGINKAHANIIWSPFVFI